MLSCGCVNKNIVSGFVLPQNLIFCAAFLVVFLQKNNALIEKNIDRKKLLEKYFYHWEYYSFFTPIWKERIQKMQGTVDSINKKIIFKNEEMEEIFYNFYGYEPDEQPIEITENTIGVSF